MYQSICCGFCKKIINILALIFSCAILTKFDFYFCQNKRKFINFFCKKSLTRHSIYIIITERVVNCA